MTPPTTSRRLAFAGAVIALGSLGACGDDADRVAAPIDGTPAAMVQLDDDRFEADSVEIAAGETVGWTWSDGVTHDVTFEDGAASPRQDDGSWQRTFTEPGRYQYTCTLHRDMDGVVVVS